MPDLDKLREIGFPTGYPKWWKEKTAVRAPTWLQRRVQDRKKQEPNESDTSSKNLEVRKLFLKIENDSGPRSMLDKGEPKYLRGVLSMDNSHHARSVSEQPALVQIPDLIDLNSPTYPISRQSSIYSQSESEQASDNSVTLTESSSAPSQRTKPVTASPTSIARLSNNTSAHEEKVPTTQAKYTIPQRTNCESTQESYHRSEISRSSEENYVRAILPKSDTTTKALETISTK
jgi:hypothetical protein